MSASSHFCGIHQNYIKHLWPAALSCSGITTAGTVITAVTTAKITGIVLMVLGSYGLANLLFYSVSKKITPNELQELMKNPNQIFKISGLAVITLCTMPIALLQKITIVP